MWDGLQQLTAGLKARGTSGFFRLAKLPPGRLVPDDKEMFRNRMYLLEKAHLYGPIFKLIWQRQLMICIVGHARALQFLNAHAAKLVGDSVRLDALIPNGFLRNMNGDTHRQCRRQVQPLVQCDLIDEWDGELREAIRNDVSAYAKSSYGPAVTPLPLAPALRAMATDLLLTLFYGVTKGHPSFEKLETSYGKMGPDGLVWDIGPGQIEGFVELRATVEELMGELRDGEVKSPRRCVLSEAVQSGAVDETVVGNLIYMVEMGRFDLHGLMRWIVRYLSDHPDIVSRLRSEDERDSKGDVSLARAVVLETLRLDQSEAVIRKTTADIVDNGFLVPKGSFVRLCMWEGHKDPDVFSDPHTFNPDRFLRRSYDVQQFAPFGMDKHRCVAADLVVELAALFVEELTGNFTWSVIAEGETVRGPFHWEPDPVFAIEISKLIR